jgi:hypothetical protein
MSSGPPHPRPHRTFRVNRNPASTMIAEEVLKLSIFRPPPLPPPFFFFVKPPSSANASTVLHYPQESESVSATRCRFADYISFAVPEMQLRRGALPWFPRRRELCCISCGVAFVPKFVDIYNMSNRKAKGNQAIGQHLSTSRVACLDPRNRSCLDQ